MAKSKIVKLFGSSAALALLSGCAVMQTRPGNPDSYNSGPFGRNYYKDLARELPPWPAVDATADTVAKLQTQGVPASIAPPVYKKTNVPREIWTSQGFAWNMHLKYQAAAFKAADMQDLIALPLFGTAIATAATGIAHASTVAVAAAGLGGASVAAGYSYLHPDKDAATDQAAAYGLECIVDNAQPLVTKSDIRLILDRAALQDALAILQTDSAGLLQETNPSATDKAAQDAVQAVQTSGQNTVSSLTTAINAYDGLKPAIDTAIHQIDNNAKVAGSRSLNQEAILASLTTSATHAATTTATQSQVQNAQGMAKTTTAIANAGFSKKTKNLQAVTMPKPQSSDKQPESNSFLQDVTNEGTAPSSTRVATALNDAGQPPATGGDAGTAGTQKVVQLLAIASDPATNDMEKVSRLSTEALQDIPSPNYTSVQASIQACVPGAQTTATGQ
jgi:hypothetical protein